MKLSTHVLLGLLVIETYEQLDNCTDAFLFLGIFNTEHDLSFKTAFIFVFKSNGLKAIEEKSFRYIGVKNIPEISSWTKLLPNFNGCFMVYYSENSLVIPIFITSL